MIKYFQLQQKYKTTPQATQIQKNLKVPENTVLPSFKLVKKPISTKNPKTQSFFKSKNVPKNSNELYSYHDQRNLQSNQTNELNKKKKNLSQKYDSTQRQSIRQSQQLDYENIKKRGFSLEYLKMTKKFRVKSLLELNINSSINRLRTKTQISDPYEIVNSSFTKDNQERQSIKNNKDLSNGKISQRSLKPLTFNQSNHPHDKSVVKPTAKSAQKNVKKSQLIGNKYFKQKTQLSAEWQNSSISQIPIDGIRLQTSKKFFSNQHNNNYRQTCMTYLKKSKYSPFKSRIGSSASNDSIQNKNQISEFQELEMKEFQNLNKEFTRISFHKKEGKKLKFMTHKRLKSQNPSLNHNLVNKQKTQDQQIKYLQNLHKKSYQKQQINFNINQNSIKILQEGLLGNLKLIIDLKRCFETDQHEQSIKSSRISINNIQQLIKMYTFGQKTQSQQKQPNNQKKPKQKKYHNSYFCLLDQIFEDQNQKQLIRQVICIQRLLMICLVDLTCQQKLLNLCEQIKLTFKIIISIYIKIFKYSSQVLQWRSLQIKNYIQELLKLSEYNHKNSIEKSLRKYLIPYIQNLYRYSKNIYENLFKSILENSGSKTINRSFYQLLKLFATYLTNNQETILKRPHSQLMANFSTCPAPYILSKTLKKYTLCIDLDQTLLFSKFSYTRKFQTVYRPGAKQLIIQLSKYFQIIIFTSALKEYADQVSKPFSQFVDHMLYRHHVTRGKNLTNTVKDLSRIGRKLQKVIFIDDLECNIKLQPQNSIRVIPWRGEANDNELLILKSELLRIGKQQKEFDDIRPIVSQIKTKLYQSKKK